MDNTVCGFIDTLLGADPRQDMLQDSCKVQTKVNAMTGFDRPVAKKQSNRRYSVPLRSNDSTT